METAEALNADVVAASVIEPDGVPHNDGLIEEFRRVQIGDRTRLELIKAEDADEAQPREVASTEAHCQLFRTRVFQRLQPFDAAMTTREHIDFGLALQAAGIKTIYEPRARVTIYYPRHVNRDERQIFRARWNVERALAACERICEKWGVDEFESSMYFVRGRLHRTSRLSWLWYRTAGVIERRLDGLRRRLMGQPPRFDTPYYRRRGERKVEAEVVAS